MVTKKRAKQVKKLNDFESWAEEATERNPNRRCAWLSEDLKAEILQAMEWNKKNGGRLTLRAAVNRWRELYDKSITQGKVKHYLYSRNLRWSPEDA